MAVGTGSAADHTPGDGDRVKQQDILLHTFRSSEQDTVIVDWSFAEVYRQQWTVKMNQGCCVSWSTP